MLLSCPYGAITYNEKADLPQKCTMCAHMIDAGEKVTRCSECCPNQAVLFGDLDDPKSEIAVYVKEHADELEQLHPEYGTQPNIYYRNMPKPFICGEVVCADTRRVLQGREGHLRLRRLREEDGDGNRLPRRFRIPVPA